MVDTNVIVALEKGGPVDLSIYDEYGETFVSAISVSELLVGVYYADTELRRARRTDFVERVLSEVRILDFTEEVARVHARIFASLKQTGRLIGAHDLIIAATALYHGLPLLTGNTTEFERIEDLTILDLTGGT